MPNKESWHLSKGVPISLIVALVLQGGAIIWTVSQMNSDIATNSRDIRATTESLSDFSGRLRIVEQSQARESAVIESILDIVQRMDKRLERIEAR